VPPIMPLQKLYLFDKSKVKLSMYESGFKHNSITESLNG
jgi:hypothetical protein